MSSRLMALPTELRLEIYKYVFSSDDSPARVELFNAKKIYPSAALLSVSRMIYEEALPEHEKAVENFWATKAFAVHLTKAHASRAARCEALQRCRSMKLLHARRLKFLVINWDDVPPDPQLAILLYIDSEDKLRILRRYWIDKEAADHVRTLICQVAGYMIKELGGSSPGGVDVAKCIKFCFAAMNAKSIRGRSWPHIP